MILKYEFYAVALICGFWLSLCFPPLVFLPFVWTIFSGLRLFANPYSPYIGESSTWMLVLDYASGTALAMFLLCVFAAKLFPLGALRKFIKISAVGSAFVILYASVFGTKWTPWGLMLNASMAGCFSAAVIPLFTARGGLWVYLLALSALATRQSQPIGMLFLVSMLYLFRSRYWKFALIAPVIAVLIGFALTGDTLFNTDGRSYVWGISARWWADHANVWLGAGLGSYSVIGPDLTRSLVTRWIWLHSDWAQILFEQGIVGFTFAVALYCGALYKSRHAYRLFFSLILYGAYCAANMPMHYPLSALYGLYLMRSVIEMKGDATWKSLL